MLELLNTVATVGTFIVIAATAVAAVLQLRHMRASNQFEAIQYAAEAQREPTMQRAIQFVMQELAAHLEDEAFRAEIEKRDLNPETHPERLVCNFHELMGSYIYHRLIPFDIYMDIVAVFPHEVWHALEPYIAIRRQLSDHPEALYEHFEWLAVKSSTYTKNGRGVLYGKFKRLPVHNRWANEIPKNEEA